MKLARDFRSLLFVPADRPLRFGRAMDSGADAVCVDLEDAVHPDAKLTARRNAADFLGQRHAGTSARGVRLNASDSEWWGDDLAVAASADFVLIPKVSQPEAVSAVAAAAPDVPLWLLVETPGGVRMAWELACQPQVVGIMFGAFDYCAAVGCEMKWEPLLFARSQISAACAAAAVDAMDSPAGEVGRPQELARSTKRARSLGFTGRACIHPDQVPIVNSVFTPDDQAVEWAMRVLDTLKSSGGRPALIDGKLIEEPVARAARRTLARRRL